MNYTNFSIENCYYQDTSTSCLILQYISSSFNVCSLSLFSAISISDFIFYYSIICKNTDKNYLYMSHIIIIYIVIFIEYISYNTININKDIINLYLYTYIIIISLFIFSSILTIICVAINNKKIKILKLSDNYSRTTMASLYLYNYSVKNYIIFHIILFLFITFWFVKFYILFPIDKQYLFNMNCGVGIEWIFILVIDIHILIYLTSEKYKKLIQKILWYKTGKTMHWVNLNKFQMIHQEEELNVTFQFDGWYINENNRNSLQHTNSSNISYSSISVN